MFADHLVGLLCWYYVSDSLYCLHFPWLLSPFENIPENVMHEFKYQNWLEQRWEWEQHYLYGVLT